MADYVIVADRKPKTLLNELERTKARVVTGSWIVDKISAETVDVVKNIIIRLYLISVGAVYTTMVKHYRS